MNVLTVEELSDLLKITEKQAKALMKSEDFPSVKIGKSYRVEESVLMEWLKEKKSIKLDWGKF